MDAEGGGEAEVGEFGLRGKGQFEGKGGGEMEKRAA